MKVSKKCPSIAYTVLCIFLLLGLLGGIKYIVDLGNRLDESDYVSNDKIEWDDDGFDGLGSNEFLDSEDIIVKRLSKDIVSYDIDIPYGNVLITSTHEAPYITYNGKRNIEVKASKEDKSCKIKLSGKMKIFNNFDTDDFKVSIYLPKDNIERIDIDFNAGLLKIKDVQSHSFNLDMIAGETVIDNCEFLNVNTDLNAGNLDLYLCPNVTKLQADVAAGNMNLYIPEDISGFEAKYEINLGNIDNNLSFNIGENFSKSIFNSTGSFCYGDNACKMKLDVSIGNISLNQYKLK